MRVYNNDLRRNDHVPVSWSVRLVSIILQKCKSLVCEYLLQNGQRRSLKYDHASIVYRKYVKKQIS